MLTLKDELLNISIADIKSNDNSLFPDWEIKFKAIFLVIYFSAIAQVVTDNCIRFDSSVTSTYQASPRKVCDKKQLQYL